MKLIVGTEAEIETIEQGITDAIDNGLRYIEKVNWIKCK